MTVALLMCGKYSGRCFSGVCRHGMFDSLRVISCLNVLSVIRIIMSDGYAFYKA